MRKGVQASEAYKEHLESVKELKDYLKAARFIKRSASSWAGILNNVDCVVANGEKTPEYLTPEILTQLRQVAGMDTNFSFLTKQICSLSIGLFVRDIMDSMYNYIHSPSTAPKFLLFSGHDNTLSPLLQFVEFQFFIFILY